jgi:hypothetical protein
MIDERRIEEAAQLDDKEYYDRLSDNDRCFFEYGFRRGYNRALKDLWYPVSEEPKFGKGRLLVLINGGVNILNVGFVLDQLRNPHNICEIEGWLYLDDLLPKEGGEL